MAAPEPEVQQQNPDDEIVVPARETEPADRPIADAYTGGTREGPWWGSQIASEMTKSFGLKQDNRTGVWSWNVKNIYDTMTQEPFWFALDYLTIALGPAKWGVGALKLWKGTSPIAKAYRAGDLSIQTGKALTRKEAMRLIHGTRGRGKVMSALTGRPVEGPVHAAPSFGSGRFGRFASKWASTTNEQHRVPRGYNMTQWDERADALRTDVLRQGTKEKALVKKIEGLEKTQARLSANAKLQTGVGRGGARARKRQENASQLARTRGELERLRQTSQKSRAGELLTEGGQESRRLQGGAAMERAAEQAFDQGDWQWRQWTAAMKKYDASEADKLYMQNIFRNEMTAGISAAVFMANRIQRGMKKLSPADNNAISMIMGIDRNVALKGGKEGEALLGRLDDAVKYLDSRPRRVKRALRIQEQFRDEYQKRMYRNRNINEEALIAGKYDPRIWLRHLGMDEDKLETLYHRYRSQDEAWAVGDDGIKLLTEDRILHIEEMKRIAVMTHQQEYMLRVANSPLAGTQRELLEKYGDLGADTIRQWPTASEYAKTAFGQQGLKPIRGLFPGGKVKGAELDMLMGRRKELMEEGARIAKEYDLPGGDSFNLRKLREGLKVRAADRSDKLDALFRWQREGSRGPHRLVRKKFNADGSAIPAERFTDDIVEEAADLTRQWHEKLAVRKVAQHRVTQYGKEMGEIEKRIRLAKDRMDLPNFMQRIPQQLLDLHLDPAIAEDVIGAMRLMEPENNPFYKTFYAATLSAFQAGHTAYNPATLMRNILGNVIFGSFTLGLGNEFNALINGGPGRAWFRHVRENSPDFQDAIRRGIIGGSSSNSDIQRALGRALKNLDTNDEKLLEQIVGKGNEIALKTLDVKHSHLGGLLMLGPMKRLPKWLREGADEAGGKAERFYGSVDDAWKLHVFDRLKNHKFVTASLNEARRLDPALRGAALQKRASEIAGDMAQLEIARYMPNYGNVPKAIEVMRDHVPFASFPAEAIRVWKNAMIYKPHIAMAWNHMAGNVTAVSGAIANISPDEIEAAREALPYYTKGKMMAMMPYRDQNGKPNFLDLSYLIPMSDMGAESMEAESTMFGIPVPVAISPTTNPFFQSLAAAVTGVDPFSGRPIEPRMYEEFASKIGAPVPIEAGTRRGIGLLEHIAKIMVPPLIPPGYAGVNLYHLLDGTKSGVTGTELKVGLMRTLFTEVGGLRTHEPTVSAQIINVRHEKRLEDKQNSDAWNRWEFAVANSDMDAMTRAEQNLRALNPENPEYFDKQRAYHLPGGYMNLDNKTVMEVFKRSGKFRATREELLPIQMRVLDTINRTRR